MKVYIASSWKNEERVKEIAGLLRAHGLEVDCFADPSTGRFSFHVSAIQDPAGVDGIEFLKTPLAQRAFAEDRKWLDWADAVVLVLPAGRSSHIEAGYAKGQGKKLYVLGPWPKGEFDVMHGFADGLYRTVEALAQDLVEARHRQIQ